MLRKLTTYALLLVLFTSLTVVVAADMHEEDLNTAEPDKTRTETPPIGDELNPNLPKEPAVVRLQQPSAWYETCWLNYRNACWVDHRYDRETDQWEWNGQNTGGGYDRVVGGSELQQQVQTDLLNFDGEELGGYQYLQILAETQPTLDITGLPDGFRPGQGDTIVKGDTDEETNKGTQSGGSKKTEPVTTQTTNQCGANGEYYKLCYQDNAINALNAPSRELNTYINKELNNARAEQGFLLIVYAPEDQDKPNRDEQRVRMSREASAKSDVQASIPSTKHLLTLSYARQATGDHPSAAYLIPDTLTTKSNAATARVGRNNQPAEALLDNPSKTINDVWQEEWTSQANTFRGSEQLTNLAENIYEEKGIRVYLATNQEEWQATDYDVLDEQLREQIRIGNSNANNPEKHPQPCTAYLLLDQQGISLYQSQYCPLSHAQHEHKNEPSNQQANRLLTSALSQTRGLDAQELYLQAYRLAEEASTLYDGTSEAEALTNYMLTNPYFETQSQRAMQASQEVILAKVALVEGNLQEALNRARESAQETHPRLQPLGADVALQAATQLGECSEIQATLNEVDEYINRRGTTIREAQEALTECQLQEARSRCELVENSRHTDTTVALEIVYVNDGLPENDFRDYTQAITRQLQSTNNLNAYQQHILFRRTQSTEPLIQTRGPLSPPSSNIPATKLATRACYGDIAVVLSEKNFLPSTIQGDGYVSQTACGSAECMGSYTLRSLAFSVFELTQEEQTITGPHTFNPEDVRIQERFSEQQQESIQDYFTTRT